MKRVNNADNLWFDGLHYWIGTARGEKSGPFTESDLHDIQQQESEDSTVVAILRPVK